MSIATHDANSLSAIGRLRLRLEGQVNQFFDRKSIHVRAQCDNGPWLPASQHADDTMSTNARLHSEAECAQVVCDQLRGAHFFT